MHQGDDGYGPGRRSRYVRWIQASRYSVLVLIAVYCALVLVNTGLLPRRLAAFGMDGRIVLCGLPLPVIYWVLMRIEKKRIRKFVAVTIGQGGLPCWQCLYDVRASKDGDHCPECGASINRDWLGGHWNRVVERNR